MDQQPTPRCPTCQQPTPRCPTCQQTIPRQRSPRQPSPRQPSPRQPTSRYPILRRPPQLFIDGDYTFVVPEFTDIYPFPHYCTATPRPSTLTMNVYTRGSMEEYPSPHYSGDERCTVRDVPVYWQGVQDLFDFMREQFGDFEDLYYCAPFDITGRRFVIDDTDVQSMICLASRLGSVDVYFKYFNIEAALEGMNTVYNPPN